MSTDDRTGLKATLSREWRRILSRPVYLFFSLILPIFTFLFLWVLFDAGSPRRLPVVVCDLDQSSLSRQWIRMLACAPSIKIADRVGDVEEGRRLLTSRRAYALVVVPVNFEKNVLRQKSPKIVCYHNMQLLTPGSMISQDFYKTVDALAASQISKNHRVGPMSASSEAIRLDTHVLFNPFMNYRFFLACALMPTMLQIFVVMLSAFTAGLEFKEGTAANWLETAGGSTSKAVLGKMLPYTLFFSLAGAVMMVVMVVLLEVPFRGGLALLAGATLLLILAYQWLGFLFVAATGNLRLSLSFAAFYAVPAFAFTGVNFPIEAMSIFGRVWSAVLPLTYYGKILIDQTVRGAPPAVSWPSMGLLALFIFMSAAPVLRRLKTIMPDARFRGRL